MSEKGDPEYEADDNYDGGWERAQEWGEGLEDVMLGRPIPKEPPTEEETPADM